MSDDKLNRDAVEKARRQIADFLRSHGAAGEYFHALEYLSQQTPAQRRDAEPSDPAVGQLLVELNSVDWRCLDPENAEDRETIVRYAFDALRREGEGEFEEDAEPSVPRIAVLRELNAPRDLEDRVARVRALCDGATPKPVIPVEEVRDVLHSARHPSKQRKMLLERCDELDPPKRKVQRIVLETALATGVPEDMAQALRLVLKHGVEDE